MIGLHAIMYSKKADATRAFFRDVLGHPAEDAEYQELYLMCDDIEATVADLGKKDATAGAIQDRPWGRSSQITLPSGEELGIYEPRHPMAIGKTG